MQRSTSWKRDADIVQLKPSHSKFQSLRCRVDRSPPSELAHLEEARARRDFNVEGTPDLSRCSRSRIRGAARSLGNTSVRFRGAGSFFLRVRWEKQAQGKMNPLLCWDMSLNCWSVTRFPLSSVHVLCTSMSWLSAESPIDWGSRSPNTFANREPVAVRAESFCPTINPATNMSCQASRRG
jgi:hypothetical protein